EGSRVRQAPQHVASRRTSRQHRKRRFSPMSIIERAFRWLGGGVFVASLGLAAYVVGVVWSAAVPLAPARIPAAVAVNTLLFTAFAFHHSLLARGRVKAWMTRALPVRLLRPVYVW